ncbi:MAG TPA: hypothetical protein VHY48_04105 [Acidobacteriaceae bacterium]|jgi:hypothetical protein|nr:hypothetical protein [Acidobacteriaceae bacterium]
MLRSPRWNPLWNTDAPYLLFVPLLAFIAILPLILHGCSCGHDFDFHLQSWLDAAAQLRHGTLNPAWTGSAAWNAGEPRFLFYPPLSWMLGAVLTVALPISAAPATFTWLALLGAGLAMYKLARAYAAPPAALLASAIYLANPYMLFTAFERTAYGELLAAIWLPLLLLAALQRTPSIVKLAIPLALVWLTNDPAAVIGIYMLLAIALVRIVLALLPRGQLQPSPVSARHHRAVSLLARFTAGGALGLALAAFYLLPAAYERRFVQVAMAIVPNVRYQDNFLFGHTGDRPHDAVLHTASLLAVGLLSALLVVLLSAALTTRRADASKPRVPTDQPASTLLILVVLAAAIAFLLTPVSALLWRYLPELAYLQFPWRLLSIAGAILALGAALILSRVKSSSLRWTLIAPLLAIAFVACIAAWGITEFRQFCEALDLPSARAQLFATHHGAPPTDEYTPTAADNDVLRWDDPSFWLSPNPSAFAANTVPNPAATILNYDVPPPIAQTISGVAPHHLQLNLIRPETLILNLRDYPAWQITRNGALITNHLQRDDGLLAVALPAGTSTIDIRWHRTWDQRLGDFISACALLLLAILVMRSRTIKA